MHSWIWTWTPTANSPELNERADRAILLAFQSGAGNLRSEANLSAGALAPTLPSRSQLQKLIEQGRVTQGGAPVNAGAKLAVGQEVQLLLLPPRTLELQPEDRPLEILFEDEHLAIINKPCGLTVHPSETQTEGTLVHALLHHLKDLSGIGGVLRPGIVHRLDKNTSGALVVTKTDAAHLRLAETFAAHRIERRYWALCYGIWRAPGETKIEGAIGRSPQDRKKMAMNVPGGRPAVTWVKSIESFGTHACWLEARLETGRTHQVRVHLTAQGHSLLGDPIYGVPSARNTKWLALPHSVREQVRALPGQALHARVLGFDHPITGKTLRFEAPAPEGWQNLLESLRKETPQ